jgi:outer membrane protein assembly factor BamE (lipoprotein component of BamABCDE complex)
MKSTPASAHRSVAAAAVLALVSLTGCNGGTIFTHGAVISQDQVDLVPVGSSREQVLLALGTPSSMGNFGNEVFYYISQKAERKYAYSKAKVVDQRVFAIYFDQTAVVAQVADYGLKDGRVFDFITRTTPTGGRDLTFLGQLLAGPGKNAAPINPLTPAGTPGSKL